MGAGRRGGKQKEGEKAENSEATCHVGNTVGRFVFFPFFFQ